MNIALVLAAGSGTRMNNEQPKQFIVVKDKPLFIYSVEAFQKNKDIDAIVIATGAEYIDYVQNKCEQLLMSKVKSVIAGGDTRQESVYNGLKEIEKVINSRKDLVLIHDSARPLVSQRIIDENISIAKQYGAADTVIPVSDTIVKSEDKETLSEILNRSELYQTQTPQTFEFDVIKNAHEKAIKEKVPNVTDDCKLAMLFGAKVYFVRGDKFNFKVTTPEDLELFKALVK